MQLAQIVRLLGLWLIIGFAGIATGCNQEPTPVTKEDVNALKQELRESHKDARVAKKQATGKGGDGLKRPKHEH